MSSTAFSCGQSAHQLHHGYIYFTDGGVSAKSMLNAVTKLARKGPIGAQGKVHHLSPNNLSQMHIMSRLSASCCRTQSHAIFQDDHSLNGFTGAVVPFCSSVLKSC